MRASSLAWFALERSCAVFTSACSFSSTEAPSTPTHGSNSGPPKTAANTCRGSTLTSPRNPSGPKASYTARRSLSTSVWYASDSSLNAASFAASPGCLSGWHSRALT